MPACVDFVQHAFKREVCRECGHKRDQHAAQSTPMNSVNQPINKPTLIPVSAPLNKPAPAIIAPSLPAKPTVTAIKPAVTSQTPSVKSTDNKSCDTFIGNAFMPLICQTCAQPKTSHSTSQSASQSNAVSSTSTSKPVGVTAKPVDTVKPSLSAVATKPADMKPTLPVTASASASNSSVSCTRPEPYGFNKSKCKNCQQPIDAHSVTASSSSVTSASNASASSGSSPVSSSSSTTSSPKPTSSSTPSCDDFQAHAFFPNKCRACNQPKVNHANVPVEDASTITSSSSSHVAAVSFTKPIHQRLASLGNFNPAAPAPTPASASQSPIHSIESSMTETSPLSNPIKPAIAAVRRQPSVPVFTSPTGTASSPTSAPALQSPVAATSTVNASSVQVISGEKSEPAQSTSVKTNTPVLQAIDNTIASSTIPTLTNAPSARTSAFDQEDDGDLDDMFITKPKKTNITLPVSVPASDPLSSRPSVAVPVAVPSSVSSVPDLKPTEDEWDADSVDDGLEFDGPSVFNKKVDISKPAPVATSPPQPITSPSTDIHDLREPEPVVAPVVPAVKPEPVAQSQPSPPVPAKVESARPKAIFFKAASLGFDKNLNDAFSIIDVKSTNSQSSSPEPAVQSSAPSLVAVTEPVAVKSANVVVNKPNLFDADDNMFGPSKSTDNGSELSKEPEVAQTNLNLANPLAALLAVQRARNQATGSDDEWD